MLKDSTVSAHVETDIKQEAEDILQKLGIPVSVVINSLYRQIIFTKGIPFSLTIPTEPRTLDSMSRGELDSMLQHSYEQSLAGKGRPFEKSLMSWKEGWPDGVIQNYRNTGCCCKFDRTALLHCKHSDGAGCCAQTYSPDPYGNREVKTVSGEDSSRS